MLWCPLSLFACFFSRRRSLRLRDHLSSPHPILASTQQRRAGGGLAWRMHPVCRPDDIVYVLTTTGLAETASFCMCTLHRPIFTLRASTYPVRRLHVHGARLSGANYYY